MKTLVISDCHNRWRTLEAIIDRRDTEVDKIVFLGDILDNFGETKEDVIKTLEYFKELIVWKKFTWCLGNHENFYVYPRNDYMRCSGNTHEKGELFRKILGNDLYSFELYHWDEYFLYSHAGISSYLLPPQGWSPEWMEERCQKALTNALASIYDPLISAGISRGGREVVGGINWLDWEEFTAIDGLNQVCGHTPSREVRRILGQESVNYCLDTHSKHYGIIEGGQMIVYKSHNHERDIILG